MKKLLMLSACLWALGSSPAMAQPGGADVVIVRIRDNGASIEVAVSHGAGKTELLNFSSGGNDKRLTESAEQYQQLVSKLYQEGYTLKSTFTSVSELTTLVFVKGQ